jgi:hypothetical protein
VYLRCDGVLVIRIAIDTNTVVVRDQCQLNIREFTYAEHRSSALCEPIVTLGRVFRDCGTENSSCADNGSSIVHWLRRDYTPRSPPDPRVL